MFEDPVTLSFVFKTVGVILVVIAIAVFLVNKKKKR
ncbi:hypothetical protein B0F89_10450 [Malaciobacter marinus]|jgi:hypothetical protein|uniref:LPXTG-motif cell wall anchor domain-containing protein n=1 Tax=Malaciobacter marinus TaxID=505249 RepID=A0AB36ZY77_9BACT|nr:hypothetical protein B0F89_10450 [Malaciobacter marinus]SKB29993.1 hypothetical protein SAMN06295997_10461 [Malaciobacter marinus]